MSVATHLWPLAEKKSMWYSGTLAWNRETLNIYFSSPERRWKKLALWDWCTDYTKGIKERQMNAGGIRKVVLERQREGKYISYLQSLHNWSVQPNSLFVFSLSFSLLYFGLNEFSHPYPNTQLSHLQIFNVSGRRNVDNLPKSSPTAATPSLSSVISHLCRNPQLWI